MAHAGRGRWQYGTCTLHAGYLRLRINTPRLCNSHLFSTAIMVARMSLNVTLYVLCLSYFLEPSNLPFAAGTSLARSLKMCPSRALHSSLIKETESLVLSRASCRVGRYLVTSQRTICLIDVDLNPSDGACWDLFNYRLTYAATQILLSKWLSCDLFGQSPTFHRGAQGLIPSQSFWVL